MLRSAVPTAIWSLHLRKAKEDEEDEEDEKKEKEKVTLTKSRNPHLAGVKNG